MHSNAIVRFCVSSLMLLLVLMRARGANLEYELEGEISASRALSQGRSREFDPIQFHLYVRNCNWLIHASPEGSHEGMADLVRYWEFSSDGTNQFRYSMGNDAVKIDWQGSVYPELVPTFFLEPHIPVLWFATASGCYLASAGSNLIPIFSMVHLEEVSPVEAMVSRSDALPHLPVYVAFLSDGMDRSHPEAVKFGPPFDKAFTNAIYRVLRTMRVGDLMVPGEFELTTFRPSGETLVPELTCHGLIRGTKNSCSLLDFRPHLPSETEGTIKDFRFVSKSALSKHEFSYKSHSWLTAEDVQELPDFKQYSDLEPVVNKYSTILVDFGPGNASGRVRLKGSMWLILIISTFLTAFLLLRKQKKSETTEHKTK